MDHHLDISPASAHLLALPAPPSRVAQRRKGQGAHALTIPRRIVLVALASRQTFHARDVKFKVLPYACPAPLAGVRALASNVEQGSIRPSSAAMALRTYFPRLMA
jgi:hypothetical protein